MGTRALKRRQRRAGPPALTPRRRFPTAWSLSTKKICKLAKDGVREELAENKHAALDIYGRAQTLLQFLIGEGPGLHVQPPLVIDGSAHARLSQLSATLASRQSSLSRRQRV